MKNAWILLVSLLSLIITILIVIAKNKKANKNKHRKYTSKPITNTVLARNLPEYKAARKKYHLLLFILSFLFLLVFGATAIVASRPITVTTSKPIYDNRDIMLCLDISGSMDEYIKELLNYFSTLVLEFKGQRVGLTIFDRFYTTIAPLTDDYESLAELFQELIENSAELDYALNTVDMNASPSAIGMGVVGCVDGFDKLEETERSRTIILATDNFAGTNSTILLSQAANYAKQYNITIFGLSTGDQRSQQEVESGAVSIDRRIEEFRESALDTGGSYYVFSSIGKGNIVVSEIVEQILSQSAARFEGAETLVESDTPLIPSLVIIIGTAIFLIIIWRLGL